MPNFLKTCFEAYIATWNAVDCFPSKETAILAVAIIWETPQSFCLCNKGKFQRPTERATSLLTSIL